MRNFNTIPANAQTIARIEACIDYLQKHHPYPPNMKLDRKHFAIARIGYESAIHILETFMCELTEEIEEDNIDLILKGK